MPLIATPCVGIKFTMMKLIVRYPHIMNGINGPTAPKYTYLVFYSSVVNGKMWCPVSFHYGWTDIRTASEWNLR